MIPKIAIIGMDCILPGINNVQEYWNWIIAGNKYNNGNWLNKNVFDYKYFRYSLSEAKIIDPQQRAILQSAVHLLENGGYMIGEINDKIGVFIGANRPYYLYENILNNKKVMDKYTFQQIMLGSEINNVSTRISYKLNLKGPSISFSTACSTSLVSVCQACNSIKNKECIAAIAGGVSFESNSISALDDNSNMKSEDGICRPFDNEANGTIISEGLGIILLKEYKKALRDGNKIYAIIENYGINNDGNDKIGYTTPSYSGQYEALYNAYKGVDKSKVNFIECHGTGTRIGDPIEIEVLNKIFEKTGNKHYLGAVKANIGHLNRASGVMGLIKTVLVLNKRIIPRNPLFKKLNTLIKKNNNLIINKREVELDKNSKIYAGVSSFGFGGTNAHVVLSSNMNVKKRNKKQIALIPYTLPYDYCDVKDQIIMNAKNSGDPLEDICYSSYKTRLNHKEKNIIVIDEMYKSIDVGTKPVPGKIAFIFPGQGYIYKTLMKEIDNSSELRVISKKYQHKVKQISLRSNVNIYTKNNKSLYNQIAIVMAEVVISEYYMKSGLKPDYLIGHSLGEIAANCIAGVLTFESAVLLLIKRHKLLKKTKKGLMLSTLKNKTENVLKINKIDVDVACDNSPQNIVYSGEVDQINKMTDYINKMRIPYQILDIPFAFHSRVIMDISEKYVEVIKKIKKSRSKIPIISTTNGEILEDESFRGNKYWLDQIQRKVKFYDAVKKASELGVKNTIEVGPGNHLSKFVNKIDREIKTLYSVDEGIEIVKLNIGKMWQIGKASIDQIIKKGNLVPVYKFPFKNELCEIKPSIITDNNYLYKPTWIKLDRNHHVNKKNKKYTLISMNDDHDNVEKEIITKLSINKEDVLRFKNGIREIRNRYIIIYDNCNNINDLISKTNIIIDIIRKINADSRVVRNIVFLTRNAYLVKEDDIINPEMSCYIGSFRIIEQEYENNVCKLIDINNTSDVDEIVKEIQHEQEDEKKVVVIRNKERYVIRYVNLGEIEELNTNVSNHLVIGGLKGFGYQLTKKLIKDGCNVIVVGKTKIPDSVINEVKEVSHYIDKINKNDAPIDMKSDSNINKVDDYCIYKTYNILLEEYNLNIQTKYNINNIIKENNIRHIKYLNNILNEMNNKGLILRDNDNIIFITNKLEYDHMIDEELINALDSVLNNVPKVLSGQVKPLGALYPCGNTKLIETINNIMNGYSNKLLFCDLAIKDIIDTTKKYNRKIKLLEIGSGNGQLSSKIVKNLDDMDCSITFSDISRKFINDLKRKYSSTKIEVEKIDINSIVKYSKKYDIIIGLNVVHLAANMEKTLNSIHNMICENGLLILIERIKSRPWLNMTWGMLKEWYLSNKENDPFYNLNQWNNILRHIYTIDSILDDGEYAYIKARKQLIKYDELKNESYEHKIKEICRSGHKKVHVGSIDITKLSDVKLLRNYIRKKCSGTLRIYNCAGVLDGGLICTRNKQSSSEVIKPKYIGTNNLINEFNLDDNDSLCLFSSRTSVYGGIGKISHSIANSYLDSKAWELKKRRKKCVSINWCGIEDAGQAAIKNGIEIYNDIYVKGICHNDNGIEVYIDNKVSGLNGYFGNHLVNEIPILPGTALIVIIHNIFEKYIGIKNILIEELELIEPLYLGHEIVKVAIKKEDEKFLVEISSNRDKARGLVIGGNNFDEEMNKPYSNNKVSITNDSKVELDCIWDIVKGCYEIEKNKFMIDIDAASDNQYFLPVILDVAFGANGLIRTIGKDTYIPKKYKNIHIFGAIDKEVWSILKITEVNKNIIKCACTIYSYNKAVLMTEEIEYIKVNKISKKKIVDSNARNMINSEKGLKILETVISTELPQVLVELNDVNKEFDKKYQGLNKIVNIEVSNKKTDKIKTHNQEDDSFSRTVISIWKTTFGLNKYNPSDNFYDIGGDSLIATQIVSEINSKTGVVVNSDDLLETPIISEFINKMIKK